MNSLKWIGAGMLVIASATQAEVTGTLGATTDYDFRGVSLSASDPALQGSIDWSNESGWYVSAWASNFDYGPDVDGDVEVDLSGGFAKTLDNGFGYDLGLVYYTYPDSDDVDAYPELYFGGSYKVFDAKLWYTNDNGGSDESAFYLEGNLNFDLPYEFSLGLHVGQSFGDYWDAVGEDAGPDVDGDYTDYSIGVSRTWGNFELNLRYVDTSTDSALQVRDDVFRNDGRLVFSVATTFPWGKK